MPEVEAARFYGGMPRSKRPHASPPSDAIYLSSDDDDDKLHPKITKIDPFDRDQSLAQLLAVFPDLHPPHALSQLAKQPPNLPPDQALQTVIEYYLAHGVVKAQVEDSPETTVEDRVVAETNDCFELKEPPAEAGIHYFQWCLFRMAAEFPRAKMTDLRHCLKAHKGRLGPAYKAMHRAYQSALVEAGTSSTSQVLRAAADEAHNVKWLIKDTLKLTKYPRARCKDFPGHACPIFDKEWDAVMRAFAKDREGAEGSMVKKPYMGESETSGRDIECGCCCSDYPFEEMVQCADGHLFCSGCLRRYVEESTFGGIHASDYIPCMDTNGCSEAIPRSEVKRALPAGTLLKYEQRQAEDAIARARLEGLVYCPFCNVPCEVDPEMYVLECPNKACRKVSCVKCREPSHLPLRCDEVEKKPEITLRKQIEETMTKALIRVCSACKIELVKAEGCNKIACRCGQIMCYVCRKPIGNNYQHFCQHPREPGKACTTCNKCNLWEQEIEDDIVKAAKEAAMREIEQIKPDMSKRSIGPILDGEFNGLRNLPRVHLGVAGGNDLARVTAQGEWYGIPDLNVPQILPNFHEAAILPVREQWHAIPHLPQFFPNTQHFPAPNVLQNGQAVNHVALLARFHNMHNNI